MVIEFGTEHDVADFDDINLAQQYAGSIGNGQYTVARTRNIVDHLSQIHIGINSLKIAVDDGIKTHQRQRSVVGMVCLQLTLLGQSHAVDAVFFEDVDGEIARHGHNHQRHEEIVATGNLGNKEYACQRGMHDTRHNTRHSQQREILLGNIDTNLMHIPQTREEESREAANE